MAYIVGNLGFSLPGLDVSFTSPQELINALKNIPGPVRVSLRPDGTPVVTDDKGNAFTPEQVAEMIRKAREEAAASSSQSGLPSWALPAAAVAAFFLLRR